MMIDHEADLETEVTRDDRPMRYVEHDANGVPTRVVYRASSLGGCDRAFVACASGVVSAPHPEWFQEVLDEGTNAEAAINAWWEGATGLPTVHAQAELVLDTLIEVDIPHDGRVVSVPVVIKGHVDGFAAPESVHDLPVLREYKKFRPSTYPNFVRQGVEINANYPWQVAAYMHAIAAMSDDGKSYPMVEIVGALWEDKVVEVTPHFIENPPIPMRAIRQKIARIEGLIADGFAPTDVEVACTEKSYPCPYWKLHPTELAGGKNAMKPAITKIKVEIDHEINRLLLREQGLTGNLRGIAEDQKKVDQARREVRRQIETFLDERGVDKKGGSAEINGVVVERVWSPREGYQVKPSTVSYVQVKNEDKKSSRAKSALAEQEEAS